MAKEETDGVWRTIGGRRVFIKDGQSLADAMKESGKFNTAKKKEEDRKPGDWIKENISKETYDKFKEEMKKTFGDKVKFADEKGNADKVEETENGYKGKGKDLLQFIKDEEEASGLEISKELKDKLKNNSDKEFIFDNNEETIKEAKNESKKSWQETMTYDEYRMDLAKERYEKGYDASELSEAELEDIKKYGEQRKKEKEDYEYNLYKQSRENPDSIGPMTEWSTDWEELDKKYKSRYEKEFKASMGEVDISDDFNAQFNDYVNKRAKANASEGEKMRQFTQDNNIRTFADEIKDRDILIKHDLNDNDPSFKRQMLGRMESDNKYYLGNGGRNERHLWAKDVDEHIAIMKALYNTLSEKERPDWLTMKDIENYEKQMKSSGDTYDGTREYLKKNTTMTNAQINEYIRKLKNKK